MGFEPIIYIEDTDKHTASKHSASFALEDIRKRAFINSLGCELMMKYLAQEGIDVSNVHNIHNFRVINENFDIADIMLPNIHIDVRVVYDENLIFIPKEHFTYGLTPDIYVVLLLADNYVKLLGFFEPKLINKNNQNDNYYFIEKEKLSNQTDLKKYIENFNGNKTKSLSEEETDFAYKLAVSYIDHDIEKEDKKKLIKAMLDCADLRENLGDFDNFEWVSYHVATDKDFSEEANTEEDTSEVTPEDTVLDDLPAINNDMSENFDMADEFSMFENNDETTLPVEETVVEDAMVLPDAEDEQSENLALEETSELTEALPELTEETSSEQEISNSSEEQETLAMDELPELGSLDELSAEPLAETVSDVVSNVAEVAETVNEMADLGALSELSELTEALPELTEEISSEQEISNSSEEQETLAMDELPELGSLDELSAEPLTETVSDTVSEVAEVAENDTVDLGSLSELPELTEALPELTEETSPEQEISDNTEEQDTLAMDELPELGSLDELSADTQEELSLDEPAEPLTDVLPELTAEESPLEANLEDTSENESLSVSEDISSLDSLPDAELDALVDEPLTSDDLDTIETNIQDNEDLLTASEDINAGEDLFETTNPEEPSLEEDATNAIDEINSIDDLNTENSLDSELTQEIDNLSSEETSDIAQEDSIDESDTDFLFSNGETFEAPELSIDGSVVSEANSQALASGDFDTSDTQSDYSDDTASLDDIFSDNFTETDETAENTETVGGNIVGQADVYENSTIISNASPITGEIPIDINFATEEPTEADMEKLEVLYNASDKNNSIKMKTALPERGKKAIILATTIVAAIAGLLIFTTLNKPQNQVTQPEANVLTENPEPPVQEQQPQVPETPVLPTPDEKPKLDEAPKTAQKSVEKPKVPIADSPYLSVKKLSWEVPDYVSYNDAFKKYLQTAGKSLKLSLSSDLLLATEYAYSEQIKVDITASKDGAIQSTNIVQSSGSTQIDNIVLQTVKNTLNVVKPPSGVIVGDNIHMILKIYL